MEIVLIRHGKPDFDTSGKVHASDFGKRVAEYNRAGISAEHRPTSEAIERAKNCSFVVCSHLPRSVESAEALSIKTPDVVSTLFQECEMPYTNWQYPKLSFTLWSVLFRIFQLAGYSPNAESYKAIKKRSKECANDLIQLSKEHESVLFVGHGTLIWFIHKDLVRNGWSGAHKAARKHWEFGVYKQKHNTYEPFPVNRQ